MPYLASLNEYLHQSSLLLQAYPDSRITTRYALARKSKRARAAAAAAPKDDTTGKRESSATLTLKTFHAPTGICLKYRTDRAAEVGRLMTGLGRLAKGELIEEPGAAAAAGGNGDRMDVDEVKVEDSTQPQQQQGPGSSTPTAAPSAGGGGGGKKKKKGKK